MTYRGLLKYLFIDHIHPVLSHQITGERMSLWECGIEMWNEIADFDPMEQSIYHSETIKKLDNGTYKPNKKKDNLLWHTGWVKLDDTEYEGGEWTRERFKIAN